MRRLSFANFIFILLLLFACGNSEERPAKLIPEEKMVGIMTDVFLLEAQMDVKNLTGDSLIAAIKNNYHILSAKHEVAEEQFFKTFQFYEEHPDIMDEMMTKVIDELSKMEAELKGQNDSQH